ncbi:hypothetical protein C1752_03178 [Acaryochloris thomasi RCC1774]|uniref:Phosphate-starvation-inducible E-like protein n=1 Tax=Acaryochloris thomasi RCC1774 TaxID=1764569 RepID=A0A2W1JH00_9CYAN|nr:phosphate-starvation-inducible PsiE family protein [Acaryochloris thomasi]PZD72863.1 hypothetical protein C1752_03178 [Acaryochloris thomasi RCC1774]
MKIFQDDNFLALIHRIENLVAKVLSAALVIVILVALFELILVLSQELLTTEPIGFFSKTLIQLFGLFLNILIALELLENVTAYFRKHVIHVELVVMTALIAVSRKIIIFDTEKFEKVDLIALALACLALSVSYWLLRRTSAKNQS